MPKTNAQNQRDWRARQTVKRTAVQEALRAIQVTVTQQDFGANGGKLNVKWEVREGDRPLLESWAKEKHFDLDVWLREIAVKSFLAGLPPGTAERQDMVNADGTYMEKGDDDDDG